MAFLRVSVRASAIHCVYRRYDEGIRSTVLEFADDTKLVARVGSEEESERERLRQDLIELFKWSNAIQL